MIKELIDSCLKIRGVFFVIGNEFAVGEMRIAGELRPEFADNIMHLKAQGWTIHLNTDEIKAVQFRKTREPSGAIPYLIFISLRDSNEKTILSIFFPNPFLDENENKVEFQQDKLNQFIRIKNEFENYENVKFIED